MNPLLEQFLSEARDFLQGIGEKLMQLESASADAGLINDLFRLVHTLKGNSGLFEFPEMTRVLHAGEDLMDAVRDGRVGYAGNLADQLLEAMDFVGFLCDEIELTGHIDASRAADSARLSESLRALLPTRPSADTAGTANNSRSLATTSQTSDPAFLPLANIPEDIRLDAFRRVQDGDSLHWLAYRPVEECFYQGDDPFFQARQTPDLMWGDIVAREPWPQLTDLDAYRCLLDFRLLTSAPDDVLAEYYRYVPDQVHLSAVDPWFLVIPQGDPNGGPVYEDFVDDALQHLEKADLVSLKQAAQTLLVLSNPALWFSSALRWLILLMELTPDNHDALRALIVSLRTLTPPNWTAMIAVPADPALAARDKVASCPARWNPQPAFSEEEAVAYETILDAQRQILMFDDNPAWFTGRLKAVAGVMINCRKAAGDPSVTSEIDDALVQALALGNGAPLLAWLDGRRDFEQQAQECAQLGQTPGAVSPTVIQPNEVPDFNDSIASTATDPIVAPSPGAIPPPAAGEEGSKFGRRFEDQIAIKSLKVDQSKIDRLMNLIGEMVVSKNSLPYLAQRAETLYGVRDLSREIKAQYAVINRIAEEMQDAIMQVRMMPVSFVFQRFPRLVRDLSRKLGKEVNLVLEGEETEADKNIIESLADPLIHIVRNSLDHGLETPELRRAAGKPPLGTLTIRAAQEADRVVIEIIDDGKGIDPGIIKNKAYEKGLINEAALERISDQEAVNLVFAAGFSTVEVVSDLSGRGVGMDVVRNAVERINGDILLESVVGQGTRLRISLPLSMAVTKVMIVESDQQIFGVPMDHVVETVRMPRGDIHSIKQSQTTVLRGRVVPLKSLNTLLGLPSEPRANADDELALLVVRVGGEALGLVVDNFREAVDIIQKPLNGVLANLTAYSGSALMGDGSVLMVLNVKEIM